MRIECINPFIDASFKLINNIFNIKPKRGIPLLRESPLKGIEVAVVLKLTGKVEGEVILGLSKEVSKTVISKMLYGYPIDEYGDIEINTLKEFGTVICGLALENAYDNYKYKCSSNGVNVFIDEKEIFTTLSKILLIPIECSFGIINLYFSFIEN